MSTSINILLPDEIRQFETPPSFGRADRETHFTLSQPARDYFNALRSPTSRLSFVLHYGYFRARGRFFESGRFHTRDIQYVVTMFQLRRLKDQTTGTQVDALKATLGGANASRHRQKILQLEHWRDQDVDTQRRLLEHAYWQAEKRTGPAQLFMALVDYCWKNRWVIPAYHTLSELVGRCYQDVEQRSLAIIGAQLSAERQRELLALLRQTERGRSLLVEAKAVDQSLRTRSMQDNALKLAELKALYLSNLPVIEALNLSDQAVTYYAHWIVKATTYQVDQLRDPLKKCLYLLAFVKAQFYQRQDYALDGILKAFRNVWNAANKQANEDIQAERARHVPALNAVVTSQRQLTVFAGDILRILEDPLLTDKEKTERVRNRTLAVLGEQDDEFVGKVDLATQYLEQAQSDRHLYEVLERRAHGLILKLNGTLRLLVFDARDVDPDLWAAIEALQQGREIPLAFLTKAERGMVISERGIRKSLCKLLLFRHLVQAVKGGELNLLHSFRYRSLQSYLIDTETWENDKSQVLEQAGLTGYRDSANVLAQLASRLDETYVTVNERFAKGNNGYLKMRPNGRFHITTPALERDAQPYIGEQLAQEGSIPILQILNEVERCYPFLRLLTHHSQRNATLQANPHTAFAGIMALGCNIGPRRMANRSVGVQEAALVDMVNWRFSIPNLRNVNQVLARGIDGLPLSAVYKVQENRLHSSSDGKKVTVAVDSLLANYSFKYYGKDRGVAVYSFVDEKQALFHSTVFSSSDREAAYVLDGLLHNTADSNRVHSTDTHGYTEALFGATHLMDIAFAPRFRRIEDQTLYSLVDKARYTRAGYRILPSRKVDTGLIESQWDEILRLMATIKLGHSTASQLFKRLNSYSRDHPLYKALKEFGRIVKSQYILSYFDDMELRQRVQKQLNVVELSNKFHDAVFWARGHQFHVGTQEEQEKYTLCRSILQNAVILWNYLTLSTRLLALDDPEARSEMAAQIARGSVLTWRHVNFTGEYDFTKTGTARPTFPLTRIQALKLM